MLVKVARFYGCRPSGLICIDDPAVALDFDVTLMILADRMAAGKPISVEEQIKNRNLGFKSIKLMKDSFRKKEAAGRGLKKGHSSKKPDNKGQS